MADTNPSLIYGADPSKLPADPMSNMLTTMQGWQNLSNSQTQNRLMNQQISNAQTQNETAKQSLQTSRTNVAAQKLYGVLTLPDNEIPAAAQKILQDERATGLIDEPTYNAISPVISGGDALAIRKAATTMLVGTLAGPEAMKAIVGTPSSVDQGNQQQPGMVAGPLAQHPGAFTPSGAAVPRYLTPGEQAGQVPQRDMRETLPDGSSNPNYGRVVQVPLVQRLQQQGVGGLAGQPNATQPPVAPASPSNPPRLHPPANAPAQTGAQAGGVATDFAPGEASPMEMSGKQYAEDTATAGNYKARVFPLMEAAKLLPETDTGPGTEFWHNVYGFLSSQSPDSLKRAGIDPANLTSNSAKYDILQKYLVQYVNSQPFSGGSDAKLASALTGNPNTHINNLAAQNVVKAAVAMERMKQAAVTDYHGSTQGYSKYLANYSSTVDPRAFMTDQLDDAQFKKMYSGMTNGERKNFLNSLKIAKAHPELMINQAAPVPDVRKKDE